MFADIAALNLAGVYIDVGGNVGNHAIFLAKFCRNTRVYAAEPSTDIFAQLLPNIRLNSLRNKISPLPYEAGDFCGHIDINCHGETKKFMSED